MTTSRRADTRWSCSGTTTGCRTSPATGGSDLENRSNHSQFVTARLASGVGLAAAQTTADTVANDLRAQDLDGFDRNAKFVLIASSEVILWPPIDRFLKGSAWLLMIVVGLILLLACTNLTSFLLARALDRR